MRYRKLTTTGDYSFGQGPLDFYIDNVEAVAQAIQTRLLLFKGAFWRALNEGLPMFQTILGGSGSAESRLGIDNLIQQRIRGTQGVLGILDYSSAFDPETRQYSFQATVQTIYSTTVVSGVI